MNRLSHLSQTAERHLSDEQMFRLLDQPDDSAPGLHLASCSACRDEFTGLRDSLANFRIAATGFAAAEAPKQASRRIVQAQTHGLHRYAFAASFATAVVLLVSLVHFDHSSPARAPIAVVQAPVVSESDEALLDGIQNDLSTSIPPSLEPLAVPAASGEATMKN